MASVLIAADASSTYVYAIKKDPNMDIANNYFDYQLNELNMTQQEIIDERDQYERRIGNAKSQESLERIVLNQLKKMGLQLYRSTDSLTKWEQLNVEENPIDPKDPQLVPPTICN